MFGVVAGFVRVGVRVTGASTATMIARTPTNCVDPVTHRPQTEGRPLSLRRNFSWTFGGNVVYACSSWLIVVLMAKLGTASILGQFALGLAIAQPVMVLAQLCLRSVQATDAKGQYQFCHYLYLRLITTSLGLLVICGIACFGGYAADTRAVIVVVGLGVSFDALSDVCFGLLQQRERMDRIAVAMAANGLLSVLGVGLCIYWTGRAVWAAAGWTAASAVVLVIYTGPSAVWALRQPRAQGGADGSAASAAPDRSAPAPRWSTTVAPVMRLAWLSLPMGVVTMLNSLTVNIPRYFLAHYAGERALGVLAAAASLAGIGRIIVNALGQAASPRLARYKADGDPAFYTLLYKLVGICTLIGVAGFLAGLLWGRPMLLLLFGPEYASHIAVFLWMLAGAGLGYVAACLGVGLTSARRFAIQVGIAACTAIACVTASAYLVRSRGLTGGAVATFVAAAAQLVSTWIVFRRLSREAL